RCLLHHPLSPTLPSTPILSQGGRYTYHHRITYLAPEYIPLEDEHMFSVEEQPLPSVDSSTTESPRYVTESDLKEYKDDETEDGLVDYPMDEGDDGDDDDGDSSGDDTDDEDEEDEEE
nr:hypothetical protein [Tanacetum cinerariifolium]